MTSYVTRFVLGLICGIIVSSFADEKSTFEYDANGIMKPFVHHGAPTEASREKFLLYNAGFIKVDARGPAIGIYNCGAPLAPDLSALLIKELKKSVRLRITFEDKPMRDARSVVAEVLKNKQIAVAIVLVNTPNEPNLLIAPEDRWAILNVAKLTQSDEKTVTSRVKKEVWRTLGYLMGASNSQMEPCVMKGVFSLEDLDALKCEWLSPEPLAKIRKQAFQLGMKQEIIMTYRKACEEEVASAPTNDLQKAVWDDVIKRAKQKEKK